MTSPRSTPAAAIVRPSSSFTVATTDARSSSTAPPPVIACPIRAITSAPNRAWPFNALSTAANRAGREIDQRGDDGGGADVERDAERRRVELPRLDVDQVLADDRRRQHRGLVPRRDREPRDDRRPVARLEALDLERVEQPAKVALRVLEGGGSIATTTRCTSGSSSTSRPTPIVAAFGAASSGGTSQTTGSVTESWHESRHPSSSSLASSLR
jgi:hypothetical protein